MTAQMKTGMAGMAAIIKRYRARRFRRGFSLFGVLLGLGLAAVVIVGAVGTYNAAREAANRSETLVLLNRNRSLKPWTGDSGFIVQIESRPHRGAGNMFCHALSSLAWRFSTRILAPI